MAMSQELRDISLESEKILETYIDKKKPKVPVNEASGTKMVDLTEIQKFIENKTLSYYGTNTFPSRTNDISVSLYFMSNKNITVDPSKNFMSVDFQFRPEYQRINIRSNGLQSTELSKFTEMAKANKGEDALSAKGVAKMCDASQIYNIYKDEALAIMRKMFSHPYHMFTGSNMNHIENHRIDTLCVSYNKIRKKFQYEYNPSFILECALDEYFLQRNSYKSLESCYTYVLAYMITHEMLHIIHHNTSQDFGDQVSTGNHRVNNIVQDSFINCKIARRYVNVQGVSKDNRGVAPIPRLGVGSRITLRAEHNVGLKHFENSQDLCEKVYKTLHSILKFDESNMRVDYDVYESSPPSILDYEGADIFISIDISPTFSPLRSNGSNIFQRSIDDIVKTLTDGKVYSKNEKVSDAEKLSDLEALPDGTLVIVKGYHDICYTSGYNAENNTYSLVKSQVTGTKKFPQDNGSFLCVTEYAPTSEPYGEKHRIQIKPYNPMDDAYMMSDNKPKQNKLSQEDIDKAKGNQPAQQQPQTPQTPPMDMPNIKSLNVGDIVWIRRLKKFGRISAINNGKFQIEEVIEKPAKVIDDSDNY